MKIIITIPAAAKIKISLISRNGTNRVKGFRRAGRNVQERIVLKFAQAGVAGAVAKGKVVLQVVPVLNAVGIAVAKIVQQLARDLNAGTDVEAMTVQKNALATVVESCATAKIVPLDAPEMPQEPPSDRNTVFLNMGIHPHTTPCIWGGLVIDLLGVL